MKRINEKTVDMIFADPPYFLSNDGLSINSGKIVSVNKGDWDKRKYYNDVSLFTFQWLSECYRILKNGGSIFVTGTHHNIFDVQRTMVSLGFRIINVIIWQKTDPPPLIYKNKFRFSYEFIIWAIKKGSYFFNYEEMYKVENQEMQDVWKIAAVPKAEKQFGYHPTQKPEELLRRIILASTKENDLILDPFLGSGTTCVVAKKLCRKYIGIEQDETYFIIAKKRIENIT